MQLDALTLQTVWEFSQAVFIPLVVAYIVIVSMTIFTRRPKQPPVEPPLELDLQELYDYLKLPKDVESKHGK